MAAAAIGAVTVAMVVSPDRPVWPPNVSSLADVFFLLTAWLWAAALMWTAATRDGRTYLTRAGTAAVEETALRSQMSYLTIAGLVFAGLAVLPKEELGGATINELVIALSSFLGAWAISSEIPGEIAATLIADALLWTGFAALAAGAVGLASAFASTAGELGALFAVVAVFAMAVVQVVTWIMQMRRAAGRVAGAA